MIRPPNDGIEVYLCVEPVDFRRQINGLATLVQDTLAMNPFSAVNDRPYGAIRCSA